MNKNAVYTNSQRRTIDADSIKLGRNSARKGNYSNMDVRGSNEGVATVDNEIAVRNSQTQLDYARDTDYT